MGEKADNVRALLEGLIRVLNAEKINYALCGGWAVALWGYKRLTTDIDLIIYEKHLDKALKALEPIGFAFVAGRIPLPSQGIEFFRVSAIMENEIIPLDMYPVPKGHPYLRNKVSGPWNDLKVPILDLADLIDMKSGSERGKDKVDIDELRKIQKQKKSGNA